MEAESFSEQVAALRERVATLQRHSVELHPVQEPPQAIEELRNALEELRVAEEELRQQNEELAAACDAIEAERRRYHELFDFAPDGYVATDEHGIIREANRAASELLNVPPQFLVGKPLLNFVSQEERSALRAELTRLQRADRIQDREVRLRPRDRTPLNVALTVAPDHGQDREILSLRWLLRDITERKRGEEQREVLDREHAVRLALEEENRRKDEFLAMLAHELRNLASPIRNAVQLLQMCGPPEPRLIRAREVIDRQVRHQARLIDDLLDISRISQGKIELRRERLDLVELVRNTVEDRRGILDDARLDLALKLPAEPVWVTGDPTRLCQVVGNLIQNATKFTETGGRVSVRVVANDALAAIIVADTGIGIDPEIMPHVFEMFAQARGRADGLGLGLTLVRGLVELHQGAVHLFSDGPGRGTEVVVSLPRDRGT